MAILVSSLIIVVLIAYYGFRKFINSKKGKIHNEKIKEDLLNNINAKASDLKKYQTPPIAVKDIKPHYPQDSVLKRHYAAEIDGIKLQISHPYPSDSTLKRHYDQMQIALARKLVETCETKTSSEFGSLGKNHVQSAAEFTKYLEQQFQPIPTDSILLRHYRSMIDAKVKQQLRLQDTN